MKKIETKNLRLTQILQDTQASKIVPVGATKLSATKISPSWGLVVVHVSNKSEVAQ